MSGAPEAPAAVSNLFCAWSKGTLTYLTLMFLLAASNSLAKAWYVGASLVALEVSHQVMVTGPSALSLPLSSPPQAVAARARDATSAVAAMPRRMSFSLRVKARIATGAVPSAAPVDFCRPRRCCRRAT